MYIPRIVITSGEPAGVGPDACVALAQTDWEADLVVAADAALLAATAAALELPLRLQAYDPARPAQSHRAGTLTRPAYSDSPAGHRRSTRRTQRRLRH